MRRTALILVPILVIILLCGCAEALPPATTAPPRPTETMAPAGTTLPPETTAPEETFIPVETTTPTVQDFSEYEAMLSFSAQPNWLSRAIGCVFEKPQDVNLYFMFYLGVDHPGSWDDLSPESCQTLTDQGFISEMDLQIMPVKILEEALQSTFGITLEDVQIPVRWGYVAAEDAYCSNHSDAFFPGMPQITAVEDDGESIIIHYTVNGYYHTAADEYLETARLVLTLARTDSGTIHAVSNVLES